MAKKVKKQTVKAIDWNEWDAAVQEYKELETKIEAVWQRQGEIADGIATTYGENTLSKFAKSVGVAKCTLERRRSVYRAWKGKSAPAPKSLAVAQELQTLPDRVEIITKNPNLGKTGARQHRQAHSKAKREKQGWSPEATRSWVKQGYELTRQVLEYLGYGDSRYASPFGEIEPEKVRQVLKAIIQ